MERLRAETADLHKRAEEHAFQRSLLSGGLTRDRFAAWLGQMLIVHKSLEGAINRRKGDSPALALAAAGHPHSQSIAADLAFFNQSSLGERAMPGSTWLCEQIAAFDRDQPLDLVGVHYVLEGSMNGNRYVAMGVRKGLGLSPGQGDRYLDPYGERQRAVWAEFKAAMSGFEFSTEQIDSMVAAAGVMFHGVSKISDDLVAPA